MNTADHIPLTPAQIAAGADAQLRAAAIAAKTAADDKEIVSFEDAVKRLPDGPHIHTFRQAGPMLLGADHARESLIADMRAAKVIEVTGGRARAMNHGLALQDEHGFLFIQTAKTA